MPPAPLGLQDPELLEGEERHTRSLFDEHKKELAAALAAVFSVLAAIGIVFCADPQDLADARSWANQRWHEAFCTVEAIGVSYRGNCEVDATLMMTEYKDFAECQGPRRRPGPPWAVRKEWAATAAGQCARRGDDLYAASGRGEVLDRRLVGDGFRPLRHACTNSYLPWAVLRLPNSSGDPGAVRCAYEFGAVRPSLTGDWLPVRRKVAHLRQVRGARAGAVCWVLEADDCVVAFHDPRTLTKQERRERDFIRVHTSICGTAAVVFAACAAWWHCQDHGGVFSPSGGRHVALPTAEPEEAPVPLLSERVQQLMSIAAQRLTVTTPPVTGDSTIRIAGADGDRRTVEVVLPSGSQTTVSQNIASDFLAARR